MPNAPASAEAIEFARSAAGVSFGVHLTFVGDGDERPLSSAAGRAGARRSGREDYGGRTSSGLPRFSADCPVEQLEREIEAQVEWARSRGIEVSHVDSHRHLHKYGPFREALRACPAAARHPPRSQRAGRLSPPPSRQPDRLARGALARRPDGCGSRRPITSTCRRRAGDDVVDGSAARAGLRESTIEIGVHPGELEDWRIREARGVAEFAQAADDRRLLPRDVARRLKPLLSCTSGQVAGRSADVQPEYAIGDPDEAAQPSLATGWLGTARLGAAALRDWRSLRREHAVDAAFDREHGVDTAGIIPLGALDATGRWASHGNRYEATTPALFHRALEGLQIDFGRFTFVDIGAGKGRALLLASEYPFPRRWRRVLAEASRGR